MPSPQAPLVSIIVPAFNVREYIARCVESLARQTYPSLEILVVDDCSTDGTGELLNQLVAAYPMVRLIRGPRNVGVHAARAAGVREAHGEYLGFVDGDDWVKPEMFERLVQAAVSEQADIVICGATCAVDTGHLAQPKVAFAQRVVFTGDALPRFARLEFGSGVLWNKLYRAELLRPHALQTLERAVDASEDYIVNVGAFRAARRVVTLPESLYFYRIDPRSASRRASAAQSFSRTVRAYVVCHEVYASAGSDVARHIDELYARQLRFESYAVPSFSDLGAVRERLAESLARLARVHPEGCYALIHTFDLPRSPRPTGVRPATHELRSSVAALARAIRARFGRGGHGTAARAAGRRL